MAVVTFVSHDGEKYEAPLTEGQSLMQIAVNNAVPGIDGAGTVDQLKLCPLVGRD